MQLADLGSLRVSRVALGTMLMGGKTPQDDAHRMLDAFVDAGGTLVDTADVYGDGLSERTLAPWLERRRDEVVLATKVRMPVSDPGGSGLEPDRIRAACDASLRRLGVDHVDLYQLHAPDPDVPLEDTLEALDGLVRAGKVRAVGASNFPAWLLAHAVAVQDHEGWARFVSLQPQYSLVERSVEAEILPYCRWAGLGVLPWGPLGAGFLTGRYERDTAPPPGSRMDGAGDDLEEAPARRAVERNFRAVDAAARSPPSSARASRRSRWPGCCTSRASRRRSSARGRPSSSTSCSGRPTLPSATTSLRACPRRRRRPSATRTAC